MERSPRITRARYTPSGQPRPIASAKTRKASIMVVQPVGRVRSARAGTRRRAGRPRLRRRGRRTRRKARWAWSCLLEGRLQGGFDARTRKVVAEDVLRVRIGGVRGQARLDMLVGSWCLDRPDRADQTVRVAAL